MRSSRIVPVAAASSAALFLLATAAAVLAPGPAAVKAKPIETVVDASYSTAPTQQWRLRPLDVGVTTTTVVTPTTVTVTTITRAAPSTPVERKPRSPQRQSARVPAESSSALWNCIGAHESGNNPTENTGNHYYGAFQFSASTWDSMHTGYARADEAPYSVQLAAAEAAAARGGIHNQFPVTSRICGG